MAIRETKQTAEHIIAALELAPHPEGGYYVETYRHEAVGGGRGCGTAIYFLLRTGQVSHWHRVDAAEIFHYYAGLPLELRLWREGSAIERHVLGPNVVAGERPAIVIPPHTWQMARPLPRPDADDFSLVGCTVTPAFEFRGFELAAPDWNPPV